MKLPEIKRLVEANSLADLAAAEAALLEGQPIGIEVHGADEGEQLTHLMAAQWVKQEVEKGADLKDALRAYTQRVRDSIN